MVELARDRRKWRMRIDILRERLDPTPQYVRVWEKRWKRVRQSARTLEELQFVEEGSEPFPLFEDEVHYYTDGSRLTCGSRLASGAGFVIRSKHVFLEPIFIPLFRQQDQCNVRAELCAVIGCCLHALQQGFQKLVIHTDCEVIWTFFHCQRRKFRLSKYCALENPDLLCELDDVLSAISEVYVIKVRAHNGNEFNEDADETAGRAANIVSSYKFGTHGPRAPPHMPDPNLRDRALRQHQRSRERRRCFTEERKRQRDVELQSLGQECKHRCKDKMLCGHLCCKRHLSAIEYRHAFRGIP